MGSKQACQKAPLIWYAVILYLLWTLVSLELGKDKGPRVDQSQLESVSECPLLIWSKTNEKESAHAMGKASNSDLEIERFLLSSKEKHLKVVGLLSIKHSTESFVFSLNDSLA